MILSRELINRYLRHIIIPEISGQGQKKIIEANIFICGDEVKAATYLIYYLAAAGVGNISCFFIDGNGYEKLFDNVRKLNNDCTIKLIDIKTLNQENPCFLEKDFSISVFLLKRNRINDVLINYPAIESASKSSSTIFALYDGWRGFIQFFNNSDDLKRIPLNTNDVSNYEFQEKLEVEGSIFSTGILGAIGAIEVIKYILDMCSKCEKPLFIDLLSMEFNRSDTINFRDFFANNRYEKNFEKEKSISENKDRVKPHNFSKSLKDCKVLIVGTGGLGSPAALALASAGVGTIGLVDYDSVEASNLNRQILHSTSRIGMSKVESGKEFIKSTYKDIDIITYNVSLNKNNVMDIISEYDVIIDGVDNFPTRYLLNDACYFAGKPMIEAGAVRFSGLNMTILPGVGPCYRCLFPDIPESGSIQSCAEVGVLGPVPGVMGFIQAAETVKLLTGKGELLVNKIMYFDAMDFDFDVISVDKTTKCKLCGNAPSITELMEYDFTCEKKN
ncbi:MAG: thiazole biosynthesis adenylyltransferase ThiF [Clostridiales bacterium]|nr:thiazole biosynthesis adenylyltransferase ThiF [Clostridiales bacterium]